LPEFKLYLVNNSGHVTARSDVIYDDIEAAMAHASETACTHYVPAEVWQRPTCVGHVAAGEPQEREERL
jgi:hypothetical protein